MLLSPLGSGRPRLNSGTCLENKDGKLTELFSECRYVQFMQVSWGLLAKVHA